jgi:hypothetical protein
MAQDKVRMPGQAGASGDGVRAVEGQIEGMSMRNVTAGQKAPGLLNVQMQRQASVMEAPLIN